MKALSLKVKAPQVSFRHPLDLNYQRTLPLPPPTTMVGLAGAALGIADFQIWNDEYWQPLRDIKVAVLLDKLPGKAKDMMTVLKIKGGRIEQRSPYFRELLFNVEYTLIYAGDDNLIKKLIVSFNDPVYPLSLGREDELIEIVSIEEIELIKGEPVFRGTAIPGDIREMEIELPAFKDGRSPIKLEPAVVENVPLKFKVEKKGYRIPSQKATISFLPYLLEVKIKGFNMEVFNLDGRNFTWMNC